MVDINKTTDINYIVLYMIEYIYIYAYPPIYRLRFPDLHDSSWVKRYTIFK